VNLLSFASSYIFLSLRKITRLNSQDFHLRTQNEELTPNLNLNYCNFDFNELRNLQEQLKEA